MPFLAPCACSADAVWQAERASTVWRPEGRKGRCESDLGPQPLSRDRPANCINKRGDVGPAGGLGAGGWGRDQQARAGDPRAGLMAQGRGLGLSLAPALKQKGHLSTPSQPQRLCLGGDRDLKASGTERPLEMREGWDRVLEQPPTGTGRGPSLSQGLEDSSMADMESPKPS